MEIKGEFCLKNGLIIWAGLGVASLFSITAMAGPPPQPGASHSSAPPNYVTFSAFGDMPYSLEERALLEQYIADHNRYSPSEFLVHMGDIHHDSRCREQDYSYVSDQLKTVEVPTYIILGDNEWNDCSDINRGWQLWQHYFKNFNENWTFAPSTVRQEIQNENFAFVKKGVLFIGINLVGGRYHDPIEWSTRLSNNLDWIQKQFNMHKNAVRAAVVFAHADPAKYTRSSHPALFDFFDKLPLVWDTFNKPMLWVYADGHQWNYQEGWLRSQISRLEVPEGKDGPPVQITVTDHPFNPFIFNRTPFQSQSLGNFQYTLDRSWRAGDIQVNSGALPLGQDSSGLTYNPVTQTFFTIDNIKKVISEIEIHGDTAKIIRTIGTLNFSDPEGLAWESGNTFGIIDEGLGQLVRIEIKDENSLIRPVNKNIGEIIDINNSVFWNNAGLEGVAYVPGDRAYYAVKEWKQKVMYKIPLAGPVSSFNLEGMPAIDYSGMAYFPRVSKNLFLLSHESYRVEEIALNPEPELIKELIFPPHMNLAKPEGITFDHLGNLYVIGEVGPHFINRFVPDRLVPNLPPQAHAGPPIQILDEDGDGSELIQLDGSLSRDPDGQIIRYTWWMGGVKISDSFKPDFETLMEVGGHQVTLKVTDDAGLVAEAKVEVIVESPVINNQKPVANAGEPQDLVDQNLTGFLIVQLDGSGSQDPDGRIVEYQWLSGAQVLATVAEPLTEVKLGIGTHNIKLIVKDNLNGRAEDFVQIKITQPAYSPPRARAGEDQTITLPDDLVLQGGIDFEGPHEIVRKEWVQLSGPGESRMDTPQELNSKVSFTAAGDYIFVFRAFLGDFAHEDSLFIKVLAPSSALNSSSSRSINFAHPGGAREIRLSYDLPQEGPVTITVYDQTAREIKVIESSYYPSGPRSSTWDLTNSSGEAVASGIYLAIMNLPHKKETRKLIVVR